jgi:P-type Cu+ transporter
MTSHDTHGTQGAQPAQAIDPICGMQVDPATAAGTSEYKGVTYYFCSTGCKRQFDKDPQRSIGQQPQE